MVKTYRSGDYEAVHEAPVWRDRADFIIAAHLGEEDGRNEWEQLWAHKISDDRFLLCCIPFFASDLALGDEVETDAAYVIKRVVVPSGHYTFRVWFGESDEPNIRDEVADFVRQSACEIEWSSANLAAIDAANNSVAKDVANFLLDHERLGRLIYETGKTKKKPGE